MGTLWKSGMILIFLFAVMSACEQPEDPFIGTWEFEKYEVQKEGAGSLAELIPENWKEKVNNWIEDGRNLTQSTITFNPDGTYIEEFKGGPDEITAIRGQYSVMSDRSQINLKTTEDEYVMPLIRWSDTAFTYKKEYGRFDVPLNLEFTYKRVHPH
ncbi:MAG: hypothetical protein ACQERC_01195 [Bacteroidota bacterium]